MVSPSQMQPQFMPLFFTTNQPPNSNYRICGLLLGHVFMYLALFFYCSAAFFIILQFLKKIYKNLSNCQTLVTSVHAKLFILHLHQLNLVSL